MLNMQELFKGHEFISFSSSLFLFIPVALHPLLPSSFLRLLDEMGPAMLMAVPVLLLLPPTTSNPQPTNPHFPEKDHFYF